MKPTIQRQYQLVVTAIDERRLKNAIDMLKEMAKSSMIDNMIDDLYNVETNYKSMLRYNLEGMADPERDSFYMQIVTSLYNLADKISDKLLQQNTGLLIYWERNNIKDNKLIELLSEYEQLLSLVELKRITNPDETGGDELYSAQIKLFNFLWTIDLTDDDYTLLTGMFDSPKVPWSDKAFFVSAVWLSMANRFCGLRANLLIHLCTHPEAQVAARARVSLLLSLFQHGNRWEADIKLKGRLINLMSQKNMEELLFQTLINIVRTRETDRITKKMNEEIYPEILKAQPNLRDKLNLDNIIDDKYKEDKNPEWEELLSGQPELLSKLEEITKWQMEGADVFMSAFKSLKQFPFFNTAANWFLPFYITQPLLVKVLSGESETFRKGDLITKLAETTMLCNSDKYSLLLSIPLIDNQQKDMMTAMYNKELDQMKELRDDEQKISPFKKDSSLSNQYIQDLYRFFKVFPRNREFEDIFNSIFDLQNRWFFRVIVPDKGRKVQIAEFFFSKEFYADAISIYEQLLDSDANDIAVIQKIAYCHQQNGNWNSALQFYLQADLLADNNHWTKKKIALCYVKLQKPAMAIEYYQAATKLQPDNLHTKVSIANCYLQLKNFDDALKCFFEVEYLEPGNTNIWRPIAWCCFILGKFDQSQRYYSKLIEKDLNKHDILNLAHVNWCTGRRKDAVKHYHKAMSLFDNQEDFYHAFKADEEYLVANGVATADLPIMLDQIYYLSENSL
jgi:tetratricopeptide (TPR) repeat protein